VTGESSRATAVMRIVMTVVAVGEKDLRRRLSGGGGRRGR